jgi:hypothetical protein
MPSWNIRGSWFSMRGTGTRLTSRWERDIAENSKGKMTSNLSRIINLSSISNLQQVLCPRIFSYPTTRLSIHPHLSSKVIWRIARSSNIRATAPP